MVSRTQKPGASRSRAGDSHHPECVRACSSIGQSVGLRSLRLQVRVLPGAPGWKAKALQRLTSQVPWLFLFTAADLQAHQAAGEVTRRAWSVPK